MANNRRTTTTTLRYLGFLKQPDSDHPTRTDSDELDEHDVVWSFYPDSPTTTTTHPLHQSPSPSPPSLRRFSPLQSGLSAALHDSDCHLIRSNVIHVGATRRDIVNNNNSNNRSQVNFRQSAPVNIPVWPKEFRSARYKDWDDEAAEVEEDDEEEMVPPHVIVSRSHVTFSVFEGVGRTLKGRDLRRVRNAVLQKTGFID